MRIQKLPSQPDDDSSLSPDRCSKHVGAPTSGPPMIPSHDTAQHNNIVISSAEAEQLFHPPKDYEVRSCATRALSPSGTLRPHPLTPAPSAGEGVDLVGVQARQLHCRACTPESCPSPCRGRGRGWGIIERWALPLKTYARKHTSTPLAAALRDLYPGVAHLFSPLPFPRISSPQVWNSPIRTARRAA